MPAVLHHFRYVLPKFSRRNYAVLMKTLTNSFVFDSSDAARFRLHVLEVYQKHGWKAAISAFKIGKSTLYDWRKSYLNSQRKLFSLVPVSTRPHKLRTMTTDHRISSFIVSFRNQYGNISKYKLKLFLDEYAKDLGIPSIAISTIGKVIKRKNLFFRKTKKHTRRKYGHISRVKNAPKEKQPGYLEMDSITLWVVDRRWYFVSLIDVATKIASVEIVSNLSSKYTEGVLSRFIENNKYSVRTVQTDNGSEFLGSFHSFLETNSIIHQFTYPRSPRINGCVERFNRTIQEEFIERSEEIFYDEDLFKKKLEDYLIWYNTKRPHQTLKLQTPMACLNNLLNFPKCM